MKTLHYSIIVILIFFSTVGINVVYAYHGSAMMGSSSYLSQISSSGNNVYLL
jgi:hypothetical protein